MDFCFVGVRLASKRDKQLKITKVVFFLVDDMGYRYLFYFGGDPSELFNINKDKAELKDIIGKHQSKSEKMENKLATFLSDCGYPQMMKKIQAKEN